jgi:ABC-type lipoprotein export system ATPase subunit
LLNLIGGLDRPTSGDILLDGTSTSGFSSRDWADCRRNKIGIVFQAFHLIPGLTAEENVALPLLLRGTRAADIRARVADVLETVGMSGRCRHRPGELSGGEQQRVAIARALVHRPGLILADEPTGNLDSHQGSEVIGLLRMLPERFGATVILVTHSQEAARLADVVWAMYDGRVVSKTTAPVTV